MVKLKRSNIFSAILTSVLCMVLMRSIFPNTSTAFIKADTRRSNHLTDNLNLTEIEDTPIEVVSYRKVFEHYYNKVISNTMIEISMDDFIDLYYAQEKTINEFTDFFIDEGVHSSINLTNDVALYEEQTKSEENIQPMSSGILQILSPDEDYILGKDIGNQNYTERVHFKRKPIYEAFNYNKLYNGDIIFENGSSSPAKHVAFLYKYNQPSSYGEYVQTIEAVAGGVQYGFLDDERVTRFGVSIYRIYRATELDVVTRAKDFIVDQVGKDYSLDFTKTKTARDSSAWYCSELIYAAYCSGGMDIVSNSNFDFKPESMPCLPKYLTTGLLNLRIVFTFDYLQIFVDGFKDGWWNSAYWEIGIMNVNSKDIVVEYNSKMCNLGDAKNWTGLSDTKSVIVKANSYEIVKINQNYFATSVAVSFISEDYRYITYGSELSKVSYSMAVSHNKIKIKG